MNANCPGVNPRPEMMYGYANAASVSKRNIAAIANAISSADALIMRLSVAIAVPPQMQVPPPTRVAVLSETFNTFRPIQMAAANEMKMFRMMRGSAFTPVPMIAAKLKVPPVAMMPQLRNFFAQNDVPSLKPLETEGRILQAIIETRRASIGPPTTTRPNAAF